MIGSHLAVHADYPKDSDNTVGDGAEERIQQWRVNMTTLTRRMNMERTEAATLNEVRL